VHTCMETVAASRILITLSGPEGLPLAQACVKLIARAGGESFLKQTYASVAWEDLNEMSEERLDRTPQPDLSLAEWATNTIYIHAPEPIEALPPKPTAERMTRRARALAPVQAAMRKITGPICNFPTLELARRAGMPLAEYADFLYLACDYSWAEMEARLNGVMARFVGGDVVRLVAAGTDITFRIKDVPRFVSVGKGNMPSGEIYFSPIPDSTFGQITYEWTCHYRGSDVEGVRLLFRAGKVLEATADQGEEFLLATLETDEGARRLGEFGIGLNPYIQRFTKDILFDEKIDGTIHLALGQAYGEGNRSVIHWDMIKDCRTSSELYLDGKLIYQNGRFLA
jgi:aminopeptidase